MYVIEETRRQRTNKGCFTSVKDRFSWKNSYKNDRRQFGLRTSCNSMIPRTIHLVSSVLLFGIFLTALNIFELRKLQNDHWERSHSSGQDGNDQLSKANQKNQHAGRKPIAWIKAKNLQTGFLDHVIDIFGRLGYSHVESPKNADWDVLWDHEYPFLDDDVRPFLVNLKPHQKINHIPGSGYYTSKVSLATSNVTGIPPAFSLPSQREEFLKYSKSHPEKYWVVKDNRHRGIEVKKVEDLNLLQENAFVQEYVSKPLLIDKRKFDIGIYTVITSINPLRVYTFEGEALLRFCPEDYYPFDPNNKNKYVVHDDYTPAWELPSIKKYYTDYYFNRKESLNVILRSLYAPSRHPKMIWDAIHQTIRDVLLSKAHLFVDLTKNYKSFRHFFEMSRFDFVVDEDFNVYLMEANMSPNLSSAHFLPNKLLYEQVIFNLLALVGVGKLVHSESIREESEEERQMRVSIRDLQVYPEYCALNDKCNDCADWRCKLCYPCLTDEWKKILVDAYTEHQDRQNTRRIVPEPLKQEFIESEKKFLDYLLSSSLSEENRVMAWWFRGKCLQDSSWCS